MALCWGGNAVCRISIPKSQVAALGAATRQKKRVDDGRRGQNLAKSPENISPNKIWRSASIHYPHKHKHIQHTYLNKDLSGSAKIRLGCGFAEAVPALSCIAHGTLNWLVKSCFKIHQLEINQYPPVV